MRPHRPVLLAAAALAALVTATAATATMSPMRMHPELAARLSGMGEHGIVNFHSQLAKARLCWVFQLPTKGITRASVRDAHGMKVVELGMHYRAEGCRRVAKAVLRSLETHPARYRVWVDTRGHPGDLRGKLFAGMAHA